MKVTFLGGADEIGASCSVVDVDDVRLLVDCGQRMNVAVGEALPDFSLLEDGRDIDAILLTHAHTDHVGALPALEPHLTADCPIYATPPTVDLVRVMLGDSLRIMTNYRKGDGELLLFPPEAVRPILTRLESVRWGKTLRIGRSDVRVTWFPAGHILGAAMIEIATSRESLLFSGDVSVADQLSVPGLYAPAIQPDLLVLESTYGDRLHAHRPAQEQRILDRVLECMAGGGHVLFPTFALGRAQEVLLLLGRAARRGELPDVPVYADGLIRAISQVYTEHAEDLSLECRRLAEAGLDPVFPRDLPIKRVRDDKQRQQIAQGPPCVVVASSGMLQGGPSQFFSRHWIGDPRNLILITGYQDEESPGQALLNLTDLAPDQVRYFKLAGVQTEVVCQVERCMLSAHADATELAALASKLSPRSIALVHGSENSRQSLARSLVSQLHTQVLLPRAGDTDTILPAPVRRQRHATLDRANPLSLWPPWDPVAPRELDLPKFHDWLVSAGVERLTLEELGEIWKSPAPIEDDDWLALRRAVYQTPQPYFAPDRRRSFLLTVTPRDNLRLSENRARSSVESTTALIRELFASETGLFRFGFYPAEGLLQLHFRDPDAAADQFVRRLLEISEKTGWQVEVEGASSPAKR